MFALSALRSADHRSLRGSARRIAALLSGNIESLKTLETSSFDEGLQLSTTLSSVITHTMLRRLSNDVKPSETGSDHTYIQPLIAASTECVEACGTLQRVAPVLPLSSPFARDLHTLFYVVSNVETQLHHFIERELLQVRAGDPRSREHGARLQDALERAASSSTVKSTVKASLLAGGIASLLHLLTVALRRLNTQLNNVLEADKRGDAYAELATAAAAALVLRRTARDRSRWPRMRLIAGGVCALCTARVLQLRLERRRATQLLTSLQERLSLLLHLWGLSTSVLQRAQKANSSSYIDLHSMDRRGASSRPSSPSNGPSSVNGPSDRSERDGNRRSSSGELRGARDGACEKTVEGSSSSTWLQRSGVGGSRNNSSGNSIEALASSGGGGGGLGGSLLPSSRSYAQRISHPSSDDL